MARGRERNRAPPGCLVRGVERLRGPEDPKLPLSASNGVQLAPTFPKTMEDEFCDLRLEGSPKFARHSTFGYALSVTSGLMSPAR